MKYATAGVRVVEVHEPDANGRVRGTVWRVAPRAGVAAPPPVEMYVDRSPPTGAPCWEFADGRVRVGQQAEYECIAEGETEFSAFRGGANIHLVESSDLEGVIIVLPRLWGATGTGPAALADIRPGDDRLILVYTAVDWSQGQNWKANWSIYRVGTRAELLESRAEINRAYNLQVGSSGQQQTAPGPAASQPPNRSGSREDLAFIFGAGAFLVGAASAVGTALGPGTGSVLAVSIALAAVGVLAVGVYIRRNGLHRQPLSRRASVAAAGAVVVLCGLVAWLTTRSNLSWAARADQVCYDRGNQYLNATGSKAQQAQRRRLAATQAAQTDLENISVPADVQLRFNTLLYDHEQIVGYLRQELSLVKRGRSTANVQNQLDGFYRAVYQPDAQELGLHDCGQETGYQ
jgi:hypothetical protein